MRVRPGGAGGADFLQLLAHGLQLVVERIPFLLLLERRLVLLGELRLERFQLLARNRLSCSQRFRQMVRVEGQSPLGCTGCVGTHQPVAEMVQLPDHLKGVVLLDRLRPVDRLVPLLLDHPRLLEDRLGKKVLEAWLVQERAEALVVGHLQ